MGKNDTKNHINVKFVPRNMFLLYQLTCLRPKTQFLQHAPMLNPCSHLEGQIIDGRVISEPLKGDHNSNLSL